MLPGRPTRHAGPHGGPKVGGADPGRDLGQAEFKIWVTEQEREDLALLLGAQDGQERRSGLSIHYQKDTLQIVDS